MHRVLIKLCKIACWYLIAYLYRSVLQNVNSFVSSILVSVNVIYINMCKVLILVWNVLLLCPRLSHGMVATQRMCGDKFLRQWLWHSLMKLCTKNYENQSIFVKVTAKKSVAPFFWTRCTVNCCRGTVQMLWSYEGKTLQLSKYRQVFGGVDR